MHPVQATRSVFPLSFLSLFCLSQCEDVCGGLVSGWWMPVGVFMVYFWPQQQKACWCSKSVAPIVSITLLLNRLAFCPWHTGKRCPALPMLPSRPWSYSGHKLWLPAKRMNRDQPHSALLAPPSYLALHSQVFYLFLCLSLLPAYNKIASKLLIYVQFLKNMHIFMLKYIYSTQNGRGQGTNTNETMF